MGEVAIIVQNIERKLDEKIEEDGKRRLVDDKRYDTILERTDKHGLRTTALETLWAAFFGDQGAFKVVVKNQDEQGKKVDRLSWLMAIGCGLILATQFWLMYGKK